MRCEGNKKKDQYKYIVFVVLSVFSISDCEIERGLHSQDACHTSTFLMKDAGTTVLAAVMEVEVPSSATVLVVDTSYRQRIYVLRRRMPLRTETIVLRYKQVILPWTQLCR